MNRLVDGKASAYYARDRGSIPGWGRSPGEGNGNPLQYSCLKNPMDGGAWWTAVPEVAKSPTHRQNALLLSNPLDFLSYFYQIHVKSQNLPRTALMIPWRSFLFPLSLIILVIKCQPFKLFNGSYKALVQIHQVNIPHPFKRT